MTFYCREQELKKMNSRYETGDWECIVIYGRRRVGKTALINEFCQNKPCIYFSALNAGSPENLRALSKAIYSYGNPDSEGYPIFPTFENALDAITELAKTQRLVFVIDEYPYLAKSEPSISSRLQHLIDFNWQNSKLYLILCGSSMSFMQNQVLGYESPLYGRRTAQFKIEPLSYRDTAVFNPTLTNAENALVYGITGGIPHYINKLQISASLKDALLNALFDRSGYLFEEPENLLKQELREPGIYNSIITAIAEGASKLNEIATKVGLSTSSCLKYMETLRELGILNKETPITEKPGRKSIYQIGDNFFRFWYRFVPQNYSAIASGRITSTFDRTVGMRLHEYMGPIFEKMCKEYLLTYAEDLPFELSQVGQWWGTDNGTKKQVQIDIVGVPVPEANEKPSQYLIGSCKFKNEKIGLDELILLQSYARAFGKGLSYCYAIFSLSGFTDELLQAAKNQPVLLITLEDMYR